MKTEFKDVAHLYLGCDIKYPNSDGGKPIVAKLTGVTSDGFETTYKRKKNGCSGDLIGFKDGREIGHETYVENCKPILKSLEDMPKGDWETKYGKTVSRAESGVEVTQTFLGFAELLKDGYDLFNLIPNGYAIKQKDLK